MEDANRASAWEAAGLVIGPEERRRFVEARLGAAERVWAPRPVRAEQGPAAGRRQIDMRHLGGLAVTVEADQFLDLGEATWQGVPVSFVPSTTSPLGDTWARRWQGGLLTTCGLTAVGRATAEEGGTHGRAQIVPARVTRQEGMWRDGRYEVVVAGLLREGALFEQNLTVERTIRGRIGESAIWLTDRIRNEGFLDQPVKVLYHTNLGWPLVEQGARVMAEAAPDGDASGRWERTLDAPSPGAPECVDTLVATANAEGWSAAVLRGPTGVFTLRYRPEQLPYLTIWRGRASGSYAVGIEPGTCWPSHAEGPESGKRGRVLAPAEVLTVDLVLEFGPRAG